MAIVLPNFSFRQSQAHSVTAMDFSHTPGGRDRVEFVFSCRYCGAGPCAQRNSAKLFSRQASAPRPYPRESELVGAGVLEIKQPRGNATCDKCQRGICRKEEEFRLTLQTSTPRAPLPRRDALMTAPTSAPSASIGGSHDIIEVSESRGKRKRRRPRCGVGSLTPVDQRPKIPFDRIFGHQLHAQKLPRHVTSRNHLEPRLLQPYPPAVPGLHCSVGVGEYERLCIERATLRRGDRRVSPCSFSDCKGTE